MDSLSIDEAFAANRTFGFSSVSWVKGRVHI